MKHKKILAVAGALALTAALAGGALALSGGDSLVSLSYLKNTFLPSAQTQLEQTATQPLQEAYDEAVAKLQGGEGGSGLYSDNLSSRTFTQGDVIGLPTGSGFLSISGSAQVSHNGVVVDVTDGREVASGARLTVGHRYLVGENTTAQVTVASGIVYLGVQGSYTFTDSTASHLPFVDVASWDWYQASVKFVYENGLFSGMSEDTFGPGVTMDRAMLVTVLYRLAGSPQDQMNSATAAFDDVPVGSWYEPFVRWGASQGVTAGMGDGLFAPEQSVTRQQVLVMLRGFASSQLGMELTGQTDLTQYADYDQVADWAKEAVSWAVANGLITPSAENTLRPADTASRAEVAGILMNFSNRFLG